jgi:hypothetical protein
MQALFATSPPLASLWMCSTQVYFLAVQPKLSQSRNWSVMTESPSLPHMSRGGSCRKLQQMHPHRVFAVAAVTTDLPTPAFYPQPGSHTECSSTGTMKTVILL